MPQSAGTPEATPPSSRPPCRSNGHRQPYLRGHNHLEIHTPSLVVHAFGHMHLKFGVAYVPSLMPANQPFSDLHETAGVHKMSLRTSYFPLGS